MYLTHSSWETLAIFLNLHILIPCCGGHVCVGYCAPPSYSQSNITAFFTAPQPHVPELTNLPAVLARLGRQGRLGAAGEQD